MKIEKISQHLHPLSCNLFVVCSLIFSSMAEITGISRAVLLTTILFIAFIAKKTLLKIQQFH